MQGELFTQRGGRRKGAGRPKKGFASERHAKREVVKARWPVHVTLRVGRDVPYLRKRNMWRAIAKATSAAKQIRIVHVSLQRDHVHILVEATDQYVLAKGMHAFQISAAHWINRAAERKGRVFPDRYHVHVLRTPSEVHHGLRYVLSNWRKHGEDANSHCAIDPYSTGYAFWGGQRALEPLAISPAASWLLREGWRRVGEISPYAVPGALTSTRRPPGAWV